TIGFALPSFFVATLLIYYVALKWGLVPTNGWPQGFLEFDDRVILPSFALGLFPMAYFARLVRGSMLETTPPDYVRTARAQGVTSRRRSSASPSRAPSSSRSSSRSQASAATSSTPSSTGTSPS